MNRKAVLMRRLVILGIVSPVFLAGCGRSTGPAVNSQPSRPYLTHTGGEHVVQAYGKLPLSFEANQGQTDPRVKFLSRGSGYTLFLTPTEAVVSLWQRLGSGEPASERRNFPICSKRKVARETRDTRFEDAKQQVQTALRMKLVGANAATQTEGVNTV